MASVEKKTGRKCNTIGRSITFLPKETSAAVSLDEIESVSRESRSALKDAKEVAQFLFGAFFGSEGASDLLKEKVPVALARTMHLETRRSFGNPQVVAGAAMGGAGGFTSGAIGGLSSGMATGAGMGAFSMVTGGRSASTPLRTIDTLLVQFIRQLGLNPPRAIEAWWSSKASK